MGSTQVSEREAEVLAALGARLTNAQIAERLHISVRTVESHVSSLLREYGVVDRRALSDIAAQSLAREAAPIPLAGLPPSGFLLSRTPGGAIKKLTRLDAMVVAGWVRAARRSAVR
jgi:DNA-binding CsgD family transcriptional regulator